MDSLLANYASSDEEEQEEIREQSKKVNSHFISSSLPPPKSSSSSSLFSFLPPPKPQLPNPPSQTLTHLPSSKPINQLHKLEENQPQSQPIEFPKPPSSSSIFSFLPPPKSQNSDPFSLASLSSTSNPKPKKIIQLKLPNPSRLKALDSDDEDDDEEREREKKATESVIQTSTVKSFLSSIPAPKNSSTLGSLPSAAGSGRRSILEADVNTMSNSNAYSTDTEVGVNPNAQVVDGSSSASLGDVGSSVQYVVESSGSDTSGWVSSGANNENYEHYAGYGNYDYYGQHESNWGDGSTAVMPSDVVGTVESVVKVPGKRGRNDIPQEIIEVKQDELMKNRPREDQVRVTGIAFGPSYQPTSTKGKPSKLLKRKHQIGSLYFDMRQKEMELAERRAKGFLTKAETQAKYGW